MGGDCRGRHAGGGGGTGRGGAPGGLRHSQAVRRPRQHLQGLIQHLEAALPVVLVGVAVEEQAVERGPQRQVILGPCRGRGGSGGAWERGDAGWGVWEWGCWQLKVHPEAHRTGSPPGSTRDTAACLGRPGPPAAELDSRWDRVEIQPRDLVICVP